MPFPPTVPPTTRANATPLVDSHPADHNQLAAALNTLIATITNMPRGLIGQTVVTAPSATTTTAIADMANSSLTFTPVVGRRYLVWARTALQVSVATNIAAVRIRDAANAVVAESIDAPTAGNTAVAQHPETIINYATAAAVTLKLSFVVIAGAGTAQLIADATQAGSTRLVVEDIGPVTPVAVP